MAGFNRIEIIGNLGGDPETRTTTSGKVVCSFSVGVSEKSGGETQWFRVQVWEKLAEICQRYLRKGSSVMLAGRMQSRTYEKDGAKREAWELVARDMVMLGGGQQAPRVEATAHKPAAQSAAPVNADDLPF